MAFTKSQLSEEKAKHEKWLQQQTGVTGTGIGLTEEGNFCLKIFTDHIPETTKEQIRKRLKSVPVDFEESGEFGAFNDAGCQ